MEETVIAANQNELVIDNIREVEYDYKTFACKAECAGETIYSNFTFQFDNALPAPHILAIENSSPGGDKTEVTFVSNAEHCVTTSCIARFTVRYVINLH